MNELISQFDPAVVRPASGLHDIYTSGNQRTETKTEKFVTFYLGDQLFGMSADRVVEVVRGQEPKPLPHAPLNLVGITVVRGEIVAVVNIHRILGKNPPAQNSRTKLIVFNSCEGEALMSFPVDCMSEVTQISDSEIKPVGDVPGIAAQAELGAGPIRIIDLKTISAGLTDAA